MTIPTTFDGVVVSISADAPPSYDAAGFADAGVTYTVLGEVLSFPPTGRVYTDLAYKNLAVRGTRHSKGSYDEPESPMEIGVKRTDAGQVILKAASTSDDSFTFKFAHPNGEVDYFQAKVFSFVGAGGDKDTFRSVTANIRIDYQGVVEVAA
jgi:hypothetical protein